MLTLVTGLLLTTLIVVALYAFGIFNTPYLDAYLLVVLLVLSVWFSIGYQPSGGYDATVGAAK